MLGRGQRKPTLVVTEVAEDRIKFTLSNTDVTMANALRRIMIAEVPTLAIELATVEENTSPFFDEVIAHRLGLLPIDSSRIEEFCYKEQCSCNDKCGKCAVDFMLDVGCTTQEAMRVTHTDIMPIGAHDPLTPMPVPRVVRPGQGIDICKLGRNQSIRVQLTATKGIGKLHAKWTPVSCATFVQEPDLHIDHTLHQELRPEDKTAIVESCPREVFELGEEERLSVVQPRACIFCRECITKSIEILGRPGLIKILEKPDTFHFIVESTGSMPARQIVELALKTLQNKLQTTGSALRGEGPVGETAAQRSQGIGFDVIL